MSIESAQTGKATVSRRGSTRADPEPWREVVQSANEEVMGLAKVVAGQDSAAREVRVLLVEDESGARLFTTSALEQAGFVVWAAGSGEEALALLERRGLPHLALIDIIMPGMSGIELAHKLHEFIDLPIIMLTSVGDKHTVVGSLIEIAEDYIVKPFDPDEMVARVHRVLRRIDDFSYALEPQVRVDERLTVEFARRRAIVSGQEVELTPTETKLLYVLMRSAGRTLLSDYLLKRIWPMEEVYEDTLRTHVYRLRKKIEATPRKPRYVLTKRGLGYSFPRKD